MIIEMLLESGPGQRAVMRSLREDLELVAPDLLILEIISGSVSVACLVFSSTK